MFPAKVSRWTRPPIHGAVIVLVGLGALRSVLAQEAPPDVTDVILGTPDRARRALSIGPTIGGAVAVAPDGETIDAPVGVGLGFSLFEVTVVPAPKTIARIAATRTAQRLAAAARDGHRPDPGAVLREVRDEVLREMAPRPRLLERPRAFGVTEATYAPAEGAWELRLHAAIGLLGISIGPSAALHLGERDGVAVGAEAALLLVPSPRPRASVIDLFARAELGVSGDAADTFSVGVRYLVDVL